MLESVRREMIGMGLMRRIISMELLKVERTIHHKIYFIILIDNEEKYVKKEEGNV